MSVPRAAITAVAMSMVLAEAPGCQRGAEQPPADAGQPPTTPKVVAISVAPSSLSIPLGLTARLTATTTSDSGATTDVTSNATWTSSNPSVVIVDFQGSKGRLASVHAGIAVVTATFGGVFASVQVTIGPAIPVSLQVTVHPALSLAHNGGRLLAIGALRPFVASSTLTDDSTEDVTDAATWSTSAPDHASITEINRHRGWVSAIAPGPVTLKASVGDVSATLDLTVEPFPALETWIPNDGKGLGIGGIGIDDSGKVYVSWSHEVAGGPRPLLATSTFTPGSGWSPATLTDFGTMGDRSRGSRMVVTGSGAGLLAWVGPSGIYASLLGSTGWAPARTIDSGTSPFLTYGQWLQAALDGAGNGLVVWADANGTKVLSSWYDRGTDSFSAAQLLPGVDRDGANSPLRLAMNSSGAAVLVCERWDTTTGVWTIQASRFTPGAGWQLPEIVDEGVSWQQPSAAIDGAGRIIVTWVDNTTNFARNSVYARRFDPSRGWLPTETIVDKDINLPADDLVTVNDAGQAIVVWHNSTGTGADPPSCMAVKASRMDASGSWHPPEIVSPGACDGDPTVLQPHVTPDGRILVLWVEESLRPFRVGQRRYTPGIGWNDIVPLPYIGHFGKGGSPDVVFNASGDGAALWGEAYDVFEGGVDAITGDIFAQSGLNY